MSKTYRIRPGESFVLASGDIRSGGEEIELDDDVAATHATRIEAIEAIKPRSALAELLDDPKPEL